MEYFFYQLEYQVWYIFNLLMSFFFKFNYYFIKSVFNLEFQKLQVFYYTTLNQVFDCGTILDVPLAFVRKYVLKKKQMVNVSERFDILCQNFHYPFIFGSACFILAFTLGSQTLVSRHFSQTNNGECVFCETLWVTRDFYFFFISAVLDICKLFFTFIWWFSNWILIIIFL